MANPPVKLSVRNVCKAFRLRGGAGGKVGLLNVLRDVSFDARQGEIISLIGESGCGKTTLLRIIQGLIRLDTGSVLVDGQATSGPGRDRGFVFQHASLLRGGRRARTSSSAWNCRVSRVPSAPLVPDSCSSSWLMRIHEQTAKTTLFVTHDLDEAIYLSDRVMCWPPSPAG